jgi:hypothetical protein
MMPPDAFRSAAGTFAADGGSSGAGLQAGGVARSSFSSKLTSSISLGATLSSDSADSGGSGSGSPSGSPGRGGDVAALLKEEEPATSRLFFTKLLMTHCSPALIITAARRALGAYHEPFNNLLVRVSFAVVLEF